MRSYIINHCRAVLFCVWVGSLFFFGASIVLFESMVNLLFIYYLVVSLISMLLAVSDGEIVVFVKQLIGVVDSSSGKFSILSVVCFVSGLFYRSLPVDSHIAFVLTTFVYAVLSILFVYPRFRSHRKM